MDRPYWMTRTFQVVYVSWQYSVLGLLLINSQTLHICFADCGSDSLDDKTGNRNQYKYLKHFTKTISKLIYSQKPPTLQCISLEFCRWRAFRIWHPSWDLLIYQAGDITDTCKQEILRRPAMLPWFYCRHLKGKWLTECKPVCCQPWNEEGKLNSYWLFTRTTTNPSDWSHLWCAAEC